MVCDKNKTLLSVTVPRSHGGMGQCSTHLLFSSSSTVPKGHWQPGTQSGAQGAEYRFLHVTGHAVPHSVYSWPSMGQPVAIKINMYGMEIFITFIVLLFDVRVGTSVADMPINVNRDKFTRS